MPRTRQEVSDFFESSFERIMELRREGQKEYAHQEDNAFANFERAAADLDLDRKMVLWIFAMKHRDGIASYLKGHESQREDVTGRIQDLIVYLFLLWAMIQDERIEGGSSPIRHTAVDQADGFAMHGYPREIALDQTGRAYE